jgi:hypothetical protein
MKKIAPGAVSGAVMPRLDGDAPRHRPFIAAINVVRVGKGEIFPQQVNGPALFGRTPGYASRQG